MKIPIKTNSETKSRKSTNRIAITSSLIFLLLLSTITFLAPIQASNPPIEIPTYAYLAITPDPIGVDQTVFLVMWLHMAPPTANGIAGDRWQDFSVTVTKPDGTTQKLGPYVSDPTGSTFTLYTPNQVGEYKFDFNFPGQVLSRDNPVNGLPGSNSPYIGDTFLPSSASETLTVQQDPIAGVEEYPLPTNYWTRPIEGQNVHWASISSHWLNGNYFGSFQQTGYDIWQTSGIAPDSPHILWTRPIEFGGVVGGNTQIPDVGFYSGGSYEGRFANSMIMYGRLYYQEPLGHSNSGGGFTCVDLKTGEVVWHRDDIGTIEGMNPPTFGQLFDYESMNQHGVVGGVLWATPSSTQYDPTLGSLWVGFDAFTGKLIYNLTGIPGGTTVTTNKGEILRYVMNYNTTAKTGWIALWNNTQDQQGLQGATGTGSSAYQWRPKGKQVDMSNAYSWNASINGDLTGNSNPAIVAILPGDIIVGRSSAVGAGVGDKFTPDPYTLWAISDKPNTRGMLLWKRSYEAPAGNLTRRLGPVDPVNRVITMFDVETMQWLGYDLDSGAPLWGPTNIEMRAYQYYGSGEGGGQRGATAYGNIYVQGFGGELFCISTSDGSLVWKYNNTNSGMDTPWGLRPIFLSAIADGKVYTFNNEHSPNQPLYRGHRVYCIDAYTGEEIWTMLGWSGQTGGRGTATALVAEGTLVYYNYYDAQIYCVGKGPSAMSVTASPEVSAVGNGVMIKGFVTDESAGAKSAPVISDADMGSWMEYLYMQKPKPEDATGVSIILEAVGPDGQTTEIGTVTSDSSGMFKKLWMPASTGEYTIVARFEGSKAYWPSSAQTAVGITSAAPQPSITAPPTQPPTITPVPTTNIPTASAPPTAEPPSNEPTGTEMYIIAAVAAVVILVAAVAAIFLRRRK